MKRNIAILVILFVMISLCACGANQSATVPTSVDEMYTTPTETDSEYDVPIVVENIEYEHGQDSWENDKLVIKVRNMLDESLKSVTLNVAYLDEGGDIRENRFASGYTVIESGQAVNLKVEFFDGVPYKIRIASGYYATNAETYVEFDLDEPIYFDCSAESEKNNSTSSAKQETEIEDHRHIVGDWIVVSPLDSDGQGRMAQCCTMCDVVLNYKTVDFSDDAETKEYLRDSIAWKETSEIFQAYMDALPTEYSITFMVVDKFVMATVFSETGEELAAITFLDKNGTLLSMDSDNPVYLISAYLNAASDLSKDTEKIIATLIQLCMPNLTDDQATFIFADLKHDLMNSESDEDMYPYWGNEDIRFVLMEQGANILLFHALFSLEH